MKNAKNNEETESRAMECLKMEIRYSFRIIRSFQSHENYRMANNIALGELTTLLDLYSMIKGTQYSVIIIGNDWKLMNEKQANEYLGC